MTVPTHEANVARWVVDTLAGRAWSTKEYNRRRMVADGDVLYSYGRHFPLVRLIRRRGKPHHWLINGDTWNGGGWSMTSRHQSAVRQVIGEHELPYVIVPQSVLDAAGILADTVQNIHVSEDWYEQKEEVYPVDQAVGLVGWSYAEVRVEGTGGWLNQRTGEWVSSVWGSPGYRTSPPDRPSYVDYVSASMTKETELYQQQYTEYNKAIRRWEGDWVEHPARYKRNGRKHPIWIGTGWGDVTMEDRDGQLVYVRRWNRHWLGESLIKAQVPYPGWARCGTCQGTGQHTHAEHIPDAEGPLTQRLDSYWQRWNEGASWERADWPDPQPRTAGGSRLEEQCEQCLGRGRVPVTKRRWAYFLSGFDHNELRPSYFFTELPPGARPTTIADAYHSLKPRTVVLAEEMGRTVLRQGDQFFIEMPGITLRGLKRAGGVHHRRGGDGRHKQQWEPENNHWVPRFQRYVNEDCWLHGTTHEATEVVQVGAVTYARGLVRHVPDGRAPDHARLNLGDRRTWFLSVPNMTPVGVR